MNVAPPTRRAQPGDGPRVVYLTSYLPPYRVSFLEAVQRALPGLTVLLSTHMERNRQWQPEWGTLDVRVQRSFSFTHTWQQPGRFRERWQRHVPWDTPWQLWRLAPDVVVSHEMGARSALSALYRIAHRRSRLILWQTISEHTELNRPRYLLPLRRSLIRHSDALIANGASCVRYLETLGADPAAMAVIPYGVDTTLFSPAVESSPDTLHWRLLYVGRATELKGLDPFLAQLSRYARTAAGTTFTLTLVGGGGPGAPLSEPLPDNVLLESRAHVPYEALPPLYRAADLTVFPSLADEWGMAVAESLACGTPVLGSLYSQAVEELVTHGRNGWTFYTDRVDTLQRAIEDCFNTPGSAWPVIRRQCREAALDVDNEPLARRLVELVQAVTAVQR